MKKILTLIVAILAVSLYSCGKDKNDNKPTNPFVGTWKLESYVRNNVDETNDCERKETVVITENTITLKGYSLKELDNSCDADEAVEFAYAYTDGKVKNLKYQKTGEMADSYITVALENNFLVYTYVEEEVKIVKKYKKQ